LVKTASHLADSFSYNEQGFRRPYYTAALRAGALTVARSMAGRTRSGKRFRYNPSAGFTRRVRFRGATSSSSSRAFRPRPAGVRSGLGVTVQHDARRIYQRKRMPRRRRQAWKRFGNKVHAIAEQDLGSRMVVFNKSQAFTNTDPAKHGIGYCALWSAAGAGDSFMADVSNMSGYENVGANPTAAAGTTVSDTTKFLFKSAILDVTLANRSGINSDSGATITPVSEAKLEVDVYELISGREWTDALGAKSDISSVLTAAQSMQLDLGGTGTGISLNARGVTPWEMPAALSYYRLKILKKTKYFVNNGDTFTYQIRDPKRHVMMQERMQQFEGGNIPRLSRHILIVFKVVPGLTVGTANGTYTERIYLGITRKYFYKIEGATEDRDRYLANT